MSMACALGPEVEGVAGRDAEGQMTNSTMRDESGGFCEARKSRAAAATRGEVRRMHFSFSRPNLSMQMEAS